MNKLRSKSSRYYELGIQLNVETNDLNGIEETNKSHYRKLIDMLVCWLRNEETHSWDEICEALRNIGEKKLAKEIQAGMRSIIRMSLVAIIP